MHEARDFVNCNASVRRICKALADENAKFIRKKLSLVRFDRFSLITKARIRAEFLDNGAVAEPLRTITIQNCITAY